MRRYQVGHHTAQPDAAGYHAALFQLFSEGLDHPRHDEQPADTFFSHQIGEPRDIKAIDDDHLTAVHQGAQRNFRGAHVIERRPGREGVARPDAEFGTHDDVAGDLCTVTDERTLWQARRSAGVEQQQRVLRNGSLRVRVRVTLCNQRLVCLAQFYRWQRAPGSS